MYTHVKRTHLYIFPLKAQNPLPKKVKINYDGQKVSLTWLNTRMTVKVTGGVGVVINYNNQNFILGKINPRMTIK